MNEGPLHAPGGALLLHSQTLTLSTASKNSAGDGDDDEPEQKPKGARRATMTQSACRRCRRKKAKCDGRRPICGRCAKFGAECLYDVAQEGLTRRQDLQQQLESKIQDHDRLQELLTAMKLGTELEATTLLARLRSNVGIDEMLEFARTTRGLSSNVLYTSNSADGVPQTGELPTPWDFAQYQFPTQPFHPPARSPGVSPSTGDWTAPQILTQGQLALQSQTTVVPSQGLAQYSEAQRPVLYP